MNAFHLYNGQKAKKGQIRSAISRWGMAWLQIGSYNRSIPKQGGKYDHFQHPAIPTNGGWNATHQCGWGKPPNQPGNYHTLRSSLTNACHHPSRTE